MGWMCRKLRSILNLSNYKLVFKHTQRKGSAFFAENLKDKNKFSRAVQEEYGLFSHSLPL